MNTELQIDILLKKSCIINVMWQRTGRGMLDFLLPVPWFFISSSPAISKRLNVSIGKVWLHGKLIASDFKCNFYGIYSILYFRSSFPFYFYSLPRINVTPRFVELLSSTCMY